VTVRARREARRRADARRLARHRGITPGKATRIVRAIDQRVCEAARGDLSVAELVREIRAEVRS
jgi:hypothetical protein